MISPDFGALAKQFPSSKANSLLLMWKALEPRYPTLAQMARETHCIPAASVGVERTFSIARHSLRYNRRYSPDTFEALMFIRHSLDSSEEKKLIAEAEILGDETADDALKEWNETWTATERAMALDDISDHEEEEESESDGITGMTP